MVCLLAAPWVQLSVNAGNGWPHNALRDHLLMPISCHFRDCKALLVTSQTHVSGAVASVQTFTLTFTGQTDGRTGEGPHNEMEWLLFRRRPRTMMTSMRLSRDVVDDLAMTDDYATEKLRLEMSPQNDDGITRLRPPPPPGAVTADQYHLPGHECPYTGSRSADTVDLVAAATPIYCPSSRRLTPVRSTEYVFSAPYSRSDSVCSRPCVQLAYETPSRPSRWSPSPGTASASVAGVTEAKPGREAGSTAEHAQRRGLVSFGVSST